MAKQYKPVASIAAGRAVQVDRFQIKPKTTDLTFEGTEYEGAVVTVRQRVSLGLYFGIGEILQEDPKAAFKEFGDKVLVRWNLDYGPEDPELEGQPIPATGDGMLSMDDARLSMMIIREWRRTIEALPDPLSEPSGDSTP